MLLDRNREIGAAFHGGIVAHDHYLPVGYSPDARDHAGAGHLVTIKAIGRQLADLQKGRAGIEQTLHPIARQQLAARHMLVPRAFRAALRCGGHLGAQFIRQRPIVNGIGTEAITIRQ